MTCNYCRYSNSGDEHRCRRCGRRLGEAVAPSTLPTLADGANALAPEPARLRPAPHPSMDASVATLAPPAPRGAQTSLFGAESQNVIPFAVVRKLMTEIGRAHV